MHFSINKTKNMNIKYALKNVIYKIWQVLKL